MFNKRFILRAAGAGLAAIVLLAGQPLRAHLTSLESKKLEARLSCARNKTRS